MIYYHIQGQKMFLQILENLKKGSPKKILTIQTNLYESTIALFLNDIHIVHKGVSIPFLKEAVVSAMRVEEVNFKININQGNFSATAWGCDMTEEYVIFNSAYST